MQTSLLFRAWPITIKLRLFHFTRHVHVSLLYIFAACDFFILHLHVAAGVCQNTFCQEKSEWSVQGVESPLSFLEMASRSELLDDLDKTAFLSLVNYSIVFNNVANSDQDKQLTSGVSCPGIKRRQVIIIY